MDSFTSDFTRDIARGVSSRRLSQQAVPQARWQTPEAISRAKELHYDPANSGRRILVGAMADKLIGIDDNRHNLTVGGSRTGKSVTLKNNLLHYRGSVLALDPKGELAAVTAGRRGVLGQQVHILDPFGISPEHLAGLRKGFNPLSILTVDSDTIIEDAGLIADALVISGGKDPHWDESAMNFIEGIILHVATDRAYEGNRTLIAVRTIILSIVCGRPD